MDYKFTEIEEKWQKHWKDTKAYKVSNESSKPKYYVLDMFPYPSGAGLHVGHPLGYIASDIYSRYKRLKGFNVLHPMGFDSFGLPAEQYAIETGQHPAETTKKNIATFKNQLDKIGFCYDWEREVQTSDPNYYKWTQKIFLELFNSYFCNTCKKALPIAELVKKYETKGSSKFSAEQWNNFSEAEKADWLMLRRLAFSKYGEVNWCEALGTVLANDEVVNGVSERGGHPVVKKKMRQWYLRITAYADRLLQGLETVDFSESMKEMQRNWIGRSEGAEISFQIMKSASTDHSPLTIHHSPLTVYTTRPDTIFGVDFMVIAPELDWINDVVSAEQKQAVEEYITYVKSRSDRERQAEKNISGVFTGAFAINPFDSKQIPIWISEYVLAGYGTGAIMAVPCGDERDFKFAQHFNIPITNIIGSHFNGKEANPTKEATLENSGFLTGLLMKDAIAIANNKIEEMGIGKRKVNFKMRDAGFSRQRYWGEPFPIVWKDGVATPLDANELPLELPHVEKYGPGPEGEGPLANITDWVSMQTSPQPLSKGEGQATAPHYYTTSPEQWKILSEFAKENRKNATEAEDALWQELRNRNIDNCKFRRQHPIAGFIPDFVCLEKKLIIEIDGEYHNEEGQQKYDEARTQWLIEHQYQLIRFTNEEVLHQLPTVIQKIQDKLSAEAASPLERGRGEVKRETSTMPGYAGSSWYFLRYMDPNNTETFVDRKASDYWNSVDLYIGGTEHAVGHLLYSRMWTKVLYDLGYIGFEEPFKKLLNQGMITGKSFFFGLELSEESGFQIVSYDKQKEYGQTLRLKYGHQFVDNSGRLFKSVLSDKIKSGLIEEPIYLIKEWLLDEHGNEFIFVKEESEKMSKSKFNVDNPDELCEQYGADTFRMYEMFLGPVEASKPWDTKGIEGVHRFLKKLWRLFYSDTTFKNNETVAGKTIWNNEQPTAEELKVLHKTIKKIDEDTERFSYNTAVSAFMVCVNELADLKCSKKEILEQVLILLTPYAPHIAEELWNALGNEGSILDANYPTFNAQFLIENSKEYPVSINGKMRTTLTFPIDATQADVEPVVLQNEIVQKMVRRQTT
jgi:leucyl-tRNA synthetase